MSKRKNTKKTKPKRVFQNNELKKRKLIAALFISLDGVTESPNKWQETFDEDMGAEMQDVLSRQDAFLMGRKTYEEWVHYWPTMTNDPFADYINNNQKYVISKSLTRVEWGKYDSITLLNDIEKVKELKKLPGKNIGMSGSATLVLSLIKANLLDELYLLFHPVIVGHGDRFFEEFDELKKVKLISSTPTRSGVIIAKYKFEI